MKKTIAHKKKIFTKKGFGIDSQTLLYAALFVIVIGVGIWLQSSNIMKPLQRFSTEDLKLQTMKCQSEVQNNILKGQSYIDIDKDQCLDSYDACLGGDNTDKDLDGLPDACDKNPDDPTIIECKDKHISDINSMQCCTEGYMTGHTDDSGNKVSGFIKCK